jgi:hypothetical protein
MFIFGYSIQTLMKNLLAILTFLFVSNLVHAQVTGIEKAEAMFIYNFSRLIEWPAEYRTGPFIIGILGTSEVFNELTSYTTGKKVGFQDIEVKRFRTPEEIIKCHVLFVSFNRSNNIGDVASKLTSYSTLIISEKDGALNFGSAINFVVVDNKLQFELKPDNALRYNLKVSQRLKEMAIAVK